MKAGTKVWVRRLVNASQHNGKRGTVVKGTEDTPGEGRVAVRLEDGGILAVKLENLDPVAETATASTSSSTSTSNEGLPRERTLRRDNALLGEFDASSDPNLLALYYHFKDREYDCYNAAEYNRQMITPLTEVRSTSFSHYEHAPQ